VPAIAEVPVLAHTRFGDLRGTVEGGVAVWRGVEHPQQPVGQRRFAAPAPLLPWTGVRDAWLAFATEGWSDGQAWCDYVPYRPR
jgi:para-nitrobenzyl esterase